MTDEQPALFDLSEVKAPDPAPPSLEPEPAAEPSASWTLSDSLPAFERFMRDQGFTDHTVDSFLGDMGLLIQHLGATTKLGTVRTKHLDAFMRWLSQERDVPCSPKSYARRVTTLKVFFGWLKDDGILAHDPSLRVVQRQAHSPLPTILYDNQIEELLAVTQTMMHGDKPDPRPHLLVTLILTTGIKKGECMSIRWEHMDLSDSNNPILFVRYDDPRYHLKERKLRLPKGFGYTLRLYRETYPIKETLFPCTARNLEYVLKSVAEQAHLPHGLSFEMMRWTCAVRDYQSDMTPDHVRRKLGLSPITWAETEKKLKKLAEPAL